MKIKGLLLLFTALLAVGLTGCGGSKSNQANEKKSLSADMSNDSSSSSASSTSQSLSNYQYKVPKQIQKSANYVKNGDLSKKHQFTFDRFGTRQQLADVINQPIHIKSGNVNYKINQVRVIKNTAKTPEAKAAAKQVLNLQEIPDTYYTFVLNYTVTNHHDFKIALNGVDYVKTNQGQILTTQNQLTDSSAGNKIGADRAVSFAMTGYLHDYAAHPATKLSIKFGPIYNTQQEKVASAPNSTLIVHLN
ncbi:hypothetical protein FAM21834_00125 [Lentilactobacillus parabuchneri]|jgi:hypothetical protein|uniref:DUF4352 domain-containing protein n=2 Tax=Lentilactobacillus parabuchneri TaxID=152331 RepID=A0A1X1FHW0_9LACO|nr:hypothetical protein [Lentilactobacillus parabuchneri]APR06395.1 hypothetical protein FAM21731_00147 [Lentilactobacillus parabuchneri]KRM46318.1 hypothetical protein FC51_GL002146 [Lentilactobacillus parabuchneri DSM 5707 = NBRC 107865]KRN79782.1 hypothetical protein IV42_GL001119 [Lentilactobacillus parabuchneri]MBW0223228.1 hypothetical protein [Lentilactobacillus parabuchneri]MBW0246291.1 hypothetical protein [Lentilactobacillus parabuchneri]